MHQKNIRARVACRIRQSQNQAGCTDERNPARSSSSVVLRGITRAHRSSSLHARSGWRVGYRATCDRVSLVKSFATRPCPRREKYDNRWQRMKGPLSHIPDCQGLHYRLQLNVYKHPILSVMETDMWHHIKQGPTHHASAVVSRWGLLMPNLQCIFLVLVQSQNGQHIRSRLYCAVSTTTRYILESSYNVTVASMRVVCLHPDVGPHAFVDYVPDMQHDVRLMMADQRRRADVYGSVG